MESGARRHTGAGGILMLPGIDPSEISLIPNEELRAASAEFCAAHRQVASIRAALRSAAEIRGSLDARRKSLAGELAKSESAIALGEASPENAAQAAEFGEINAEREIVELRSQGLGARLVEAERRELDLHRQLDLCWGRWAGEYVAQIISDYERAANEAARAAEVGFAILSALGQNGPAQRLLNAGASIVSEIRLGHGNVRRPAQDGWKSNERAVGAMQKIIATRREIYAGAE